jgi:uncharacterized membrane protein
VIAAVVCGASGMYLILHDQAYVAAEQNRSKSQGQPPLETTGGRATQPKRSDPSTTGSLPDEEQWEETLETLASHQETIYELLIEADGELPQQQLVDETDLSKATVSRTLDKLENRGLVERKRSGMGNTILIE